MINNYHCIFLPFPPSVNAAYAGKARRYKSKQYQNWLDRALLSLLQQKIFGTIDYRCHVKMTFGRPDNRVRDVANYEKLVSDFLVKMELLADDSLIESIWLLWDDGSQLVQGVRVEIFNITDIVLFGGN